MRRGRVWILTPTQQTHLYMVLLPCLRPLWEGKAVTMVRRGMAMVVSPKLCPRGQLSHATVEGPARQSTTMTKTVRQRVTRRRRDSRGRQNQRQSAPSVPSHFSLTAPTRPTPPAASALCNDKEGAWRVVMWPDSPPGWVWSLTIELTLSLRPSETDMRGYPKIVHCRLVTW